MVDEKKPETEEPVPLLEMRQMWQADAAAAAEAKGEEVPPTVALAVVVSFMQKLENCIWEATQVPSFAKKKTLTLPADKGLASICGFPYGPQSSQTLYAKEIKSHLRMTFVGKVTRLPSKLALPLCEAFGESFWVEGRPGNVMTDAFVPAWSI